MYVYLIQWFTAWYDRAGTLTAYHIVQAHCFRSHSGRHHLICHNVASKLQYHQNLIMGRHCTLQGAVHIDRYHPRSRVRRPRSSSSVSLQGAPQEQHFRFQWQ